MKPKLKKGDQVLMHTCGEAEHYHDVIWIIKDDPFISQSGDEVVFLDGFRGYFLCEFLRKVTQ